MERSYISGIQHVHLVHILVFYIQKWMECDWYRGEEEINLTRPGPRKLHKHSIAEHGKRENAVIERNKVCLEGRINYDRRLLRRSDEIPVDPPERPSGLFFDNLASTA